MVHAWVASSRRPPAVVAGVSAGAVTAAVFQRTFRAEREEERWAFLRRHLDLLSEGPLVPVLEGLPSPADLRGAPPIADPATPEPLRASEADALIRRAWLGAFLAWAYRLGVPLSSLARAAASYVRFREAPPGPGSLGRLVLLLGRGAPLATRLAAHLALRAPLAVPRPGGGRGPLLGAPLHALAFLLVAGAAALLGSAALLAFTPLAAAAGTALPPWLEPPEPSLLLAVLLASAGLWVAAASAFALPPLRRLVLRGAARGLGASLLSPFPLERRLRKLFAPAGDEPLVGEEPMPLLAVAAPLQALRRPRPGKAGSEPLAAYQLWARGGTPLLTALRAALAVPGLLPPVRVSSEEAERSWLSPRTRLPEGAASLDLVDGAAIRQNPLPALFAFLKSRPELARRLSVGNGPRRPALLVVHGVPVAAGAAGGEPVPAGRVNLVDVGRSALRLARRRDTQLEVEQTNFVSRLEARIGVEAAPPAAATYPLFAGEIAPEDDLVFANALSPRCDEILGAAAHGCRRTLEALHGEDLARFPGEGPVRCAALLRRVAPSRGLAGTEPEPGLAEVCQRCLGLLARPEAAPAAEGSTPRPVLSTAGHPSPLPDSLSGREPRIAVVASGGVLRGAFHVGLAGALSASRVRPDLVAGASVGTLLGGAIATLSTLPDAKRGALLFDLVDLFARAPERVTLTAPFLRALAELSSRAESVDLSPNALRRHLLAGRSADAGFAALGAPPLLVDAIATLLLLPHRETAAVASAAVAGREAEALALLLEGLKAETLPRLGISESLLGASLLAPAVRRLLAPDGSGLDLSARQPWREHGTLLVATAADLGSGAPVLLGDESLRPGAPYDLVEAFLASSAFPCVFAPRRESDVFPGTGRPDVHLSDGGMFDNLPFAPALRVLSAAQREARAFGRVGKAPREALRDRREAPDLLIAASLDVPPERDPLASRPADGLLDSVRRASALSKNVKVRAVSWTLERVDAQLARLLAAPAAPGDERDLDGVVSAAVLPVFPASEAHLSPTFALARTLGLDASRVARSIGDGCYQTLFALLSAPEGAGGLTARSVARLTEARRLPLLLPRDERASAGECPFFLMARAGTPPGSPPSSFACPFHEAGSGKGTAGLVARTCAGDRAHRLGRSEV